MRVINTVLFYILLNYLLVTSINLIVQNVVFQRGLELIEIAKQGVTINLVVIILLVSYASIKTWEEENR